MNYSLLFLSKARQELLAAWEWYEDRQEGLGDRFKKAIYVELGHIIQHPEHHPERKRHYREANIAIFPYLIIYRIKNRSKEIVIVSVFHTSRHPRKKHQK